MKALRTILTSTIMLGVMVTSSSAFAWTCKAKNHRGATYVGVGAVKVNAESRALAKCYADSGAPGSCVIISCY